MTQAYFFRYWKGVLKTLFVAALLYFLGKKGFISLEATGRAFYNPGKLVPGMLLLVISSFLAAWRWHILMRAQNIRIPGRRTLQLAFVGLFFNIALPGAVSGDFVKAFYVAKEIQSKKGYAFGSILFDRVAGLSALVLLSAGALFLEFNSLRGTALLKGIQVFITISAVCVLAFFTYLFLVREKHDPLLWLFRWLEKQHASAGSLTRIYEGIRVYHARKLVVIKIMLISLVIHVMVCSACVMFARALGEDGVPVLPVFIVVPLGLLVTAIPILPAGVGTGHAAFGWLFQFLGSQRGADLFSLFALTQFMIGGIGGLVYLKFKSKAPKLELPATGEMQ